MNSIVKHWFVLVVITPLLFISASGPNAVKFHKGSLSSAKDLAAREGKLYMVDFVARWCMPCRWMEETTFSDPQVSKYLGENYVSVKIDIDDFDGFAYKQLYGIKILPSILIFNSKGELLSQYQESLSPSRMLKILQKHNTGKNRVAFASGETSTPILKKEETAAAAPQPTVRPAHRPPTVASAPSKPTVSKPTVSKPKITKPTAPAKKPQVVASAPSKPKKKWKPATTSSNTAITDEGLYRFKVSRQASDGFSVQIGAYKEYGNVLREVATLEDRFKEPIIVHISKQQNQPVYKVMVGEFGERAQAEHFKKFVVQSGLQALVKDLSLF